MLIEISHPRLIISLLGLMAASSQKISSSGYSVQMISPQTTISGTNVTVHALSGREVPRQMLISPLQSRPPVQVIAKILLKCTRKENKKESRNFYLRNINPSTVTTTAALKTLIKAQLSSELDKEFDIGYEEGKGTVVVSIRSSDDLCELWSTIQKGKSITLWCNGLKKVSQNKYLSTSEYSDDDEPEETSKKSSKPKKKKRKEVDDRNEAVESTVEELKELHEKSGYTPMQFRIWAEMYNGGIHSSLEEPPSSTMFVRAGSGNPKKTKNTSQSSPNDSFSQAITQIASALLPNGTANSSQSRGSTLGTSPAKIIDNRSKCYKQLAELNNLKLTGLLNDEEYATERQAIIEVLNQLKK